MTEELSNLDTRNRFPPSWAFDEPSKTQKQALTALDTYGQKDTTEKVVVVFKAIGNAPIMRKNLYRVTAANQFQVVIQFLRKQLGWKAGDPLFTYINQSFCPTPDDTVSNLFKLFRTDGHLIVNYSTTAAWG